MNNVIGLQEYRERRNLARPLPEEPPDPDVWACGSCACARWVVLSSGEVRCANCESRSANLVIVHLRHS